MSVRIPVPDENGVYRYPDGSGFRRNPRTGKFTGWWANQVVLKGDCDETSYFDTAEEVALCIEAGEEGPFRERASLAARDQVWKFAIPVDQLADVVTIQMPHGAQVLSVGNQNEQMCFWARVNPNEGRRAARKFVVSGTGRPLPEVTGRFLGAVQFVGGKLVVHVFET